MNWQPWHASKDSALAFIASPEFSHGRAHYVGFLNGYVVHLYKRNAASPTGVTVWGDVPDCEEIATAIRAARSAIEPPHA